ncbi:hypothetical protein C8J56DRAFT_949332 [Mycena floridula]|nr:hypothetical protein C8J56DRAFT_949332 [Mycena floridula]
MACSVVCLNAYMAVIKVFQQELTCNQAIIGGSFALQYFSRSFFPSLDMDIYVSVALAQGTMQSCLRAGYCECPRPQETWCWMDRLEYFEATGEPQEGMPRGILDLYNEDRKNIQVVIVPDSHSRPSLASIPVWILSFTCHHHYVMLHKHLGSG